MLNRVKLVNWIPAILWALLIFFQSANPAPPGADMAPDYVLHFLAYGILSAAVLHGFAGGLRSLWLGRFTFQQAVFSALLAVLYGFSDEWHQSFVPQRNSSWADIAADFLGAMVFMLLMMAWKTARKNKQELL